MKKMNNKGFSLVELIVVVLIMAIIAVALAPQVMRWVENSRKSNDIESYNSLVTACNTASTDEAVVTAVKGATGGLTITLSASGVGGTGWSNTALANNIKRTLPELNDGNDKIKITSSDWASNTYVITLTFSSGDGIKVSRTSAPNKDFS
jgi:type IV pilus assembly protein PilA